MSDMFQCEKCGCCCRSIGKMIIATQSFLNTYPDEATPILVEVAQFPYTVEEDGCCPQLDKESNLCKVYYNRPRVCDVESMWISHWSAFMNREEWYKQSKISCAKLQARYKKPEAA